MALPIKAYGAASPAKMPIQDNEPDDVSKANAIRRRVKKTTDPTDQAADIVSSRKQPQV